MKVYNQKLIESVDGSFKFVTMLGVTGVYKGLDSNGDNIVVHITPLKENRENIPWYSLLSIDCDIVSAYKP